VRQSTYKVGRALDPWELASYAQAERDRAIDLGTAGMGSGVSEHHDPAAKGQGHGKNPGRIDPAIGICARGHVGSGAATNVHEEQHRYELCNTGFNLDHVARVRLLDLRRAIGGCARRIPLEKVLLTGSKHDVATGKHGTHCG
jgi:hypothetical protein